jgi:MFS family permease
MVSPRAQFATASYRLHQESPVQAAVPLRDIDDVVAFINSRPSLHGHAGLVWWLLLGGLFLEALSHSALSVGLPAMIGQLGLGPPEVAWLASSAAASALLANPLGGWLADRWGRRRPLLLAKLLALGGAVLVACAPDFASILTGRLLAGIAFGLDFAVAMAMLAEITPQHLRSRLTLWQALWYLAVCGNLLLVLLVEPWDVGQSLWRYPLAATALAAFLMLNLQLLFLVESPCWLARRRRWQECAEALSRLFDAPYFQLLEHHPSQHNGGLAKAPHASLRQLLHPPYLLRLILAATVQVVQAVQYFAIGWYLPILGLELFGEDARQAAWGALVFNLCGIAGGLLAPWLARRLGLRNAAACGFGATGLVLLMLAASWPQLRSWQAWLLPSLFLLCHAAGPGASGKSLSSLSFPSELRARANGITGALGAGGATLGLLLFPLLQASLGSSLCLLLVAMLPLAASALCRLIPWDPERVDFHPDLECPCAVADTSDPAPYPSDRRRHERS